MPAKQFSALFILFSVLFFSCRKTDHSPASIQDEVTQKFLTAPANTTPEVTAIIKNIEKQNNQYGFITNLVKRVGFPKWDKARIAGGKKAATNGRSSIDTNAKFIYIPFARDTDNYVNASLVVKIKDRDTGFAMLYANRYPLFGFDTLKNDSWNARNVFQLFATFDYVIFGHRQFLIKDKRIFPWGKDSVKLVGTIEKINQHNTGGRTLLYSETECVTITWCYKTVNETYNAVRTVSSTPACDRTETREYCTTFYYEDPGGDAFYYNNTNTGGGTTTGWFYPPTCPSGTQPERLQVVLPCETTGGWTSTEPSTNTLPQPAFTWSYTGDNGESLEDIYPNNKPEFQFPPNSNYETLYPWFTDLVKNLKDFVKNSPEVMSALQKYSGFSKNKILEHLSFGKGPVIKIEEMGGKFGYYNKDVGENVLHIRASYVRGLESAFLEHTKRGTDFLLAVTILHEFVHFGVQINNIQKGVYEWGDLFEKDAIGIYVNELNANKISIRYDKYF